MVDLIQFGQFFVNGLVVGAILSLTAIGLTLVYGILNLPNFSHGDVVTLGAYFGLFFTALISLPRTMTWATGLVIVLLAFAAFDRFLRPRLIQRLSPARRWKPHGLSREETIGAVFVAAGLIAVMLGIRFPVNVTTATGFMSGMGVATLFLFAGALTAASGEAAADRRLLGGGVLAGIAIAVFTGWIAPLLLGGGLDPAWAVTLGLATASGSGLAARRALLNDPRVRAGLGLAVLVIAYLFGSRLILGVIMAIAGVMLVSVLFDILVWRRLRRQRAGLIMGIIVAIGIALFLRNTIIMRWGAGTRTYPETLRRGVPILGTDILITPNQILVLVVTLVTIILVHVLLRYTRTGKAMRALSDDLNLARISGIDVDRVILYVWAIGGGLAALSGVLLGLIRPIHPNLGWFLLLPIFASVILGGIGSAYGAMAGGLIIGLAMEVSPFFGINPEYKLVVGFALLILVLLVRPKGIFGGQATR